jgi:glycosyltransferase involved in cell wall biosynthesis
VDRFIFVSRHTWDAFGYSVPAARGSVIYDGIEGCPIDRNVARQRLLAQFSLPADTKLVGMIGRLAAQKDHATLFRAAARVVPAYPNVRFLVVGDHTANEAFRRHYHELAQLIEAQALTPYFIFTGFRDDIPQLISGLDVSVLSTHFEGFPLVILEAMAQQIPVIATAVGGIPEIVFDRDTGLLHQHADEAQLASQILGVLSNAALSQHLADAGRRLVEERFTLRRFAAEIEATYRGMLPPRRIASASQQPLESVR